MKRIIFCILCLLFVNINNDVSAQGYRNLKPIHVEGKKLYDSDNYPLVLHGVMDTPSTYFDGGRWEGSEDITDYASCRNCYNYFNKLFTAMTDTAQGSYCNVFRLHLDPAWTNYRSSDRASWKTGWPQSDFESGGGEADITHYSGAKLTQGLKVIYWKIAEYGLKHGLYIIMRPPGVCPQKIKIGGDYQNFLIDVWDRVTKNDSILKYYGVVSIELANEPVNIYESDGVTRKSTTMRDYFQPVINKIRENGFKGIIWVPGTGYQSNYAEYNTYPPKDELKNMGYAVHVYSGWYGNMTDETAKGSTFAQNFLSQVPVVKKAPIMVTEIDWSPYIEPRVIDKYNEFNQPVYKNLGTWATGSTSKWGKAWKYVHDYFGNIGMTLTHTHDYMDIDEYLKSGKLIPSFVQNYPNQASEACGVACFEWYKIWWQKNLDAAAEVRATAISEVNVSENSSDEQIFSLDGRRQTSLQNGMNIVRMSDGSVRKVMK